MTSLKIIRAAAAACSLTLMGLPMAYAQGTDSATGSTDIYTTNFRTRFTGEGVMSRNPAAAGRGGSTDIYGTDFKRASATDVSALTVPNTAAYGGSTDIYATNFQKAAL